MGVMLDRGRGCVSIAGVREVLAYVDPTGKSPFERWFSSLDLVAATRVTGALRKLKAGLIGNLKAVGQGVSECKIDFGPGYRVYLAFDGPLLILLLGGGDKSTQSGDIVAAQKSWAAYKANKRQVQ
jgi:putative addiction module killer protein